MLNLISLDRSCTKVWIFLALTIFYDGIVRFVFNPRLEPIIPTHVRAQVDSTREALDN
jgi:hypothetical protein